MTLDEIKNYLRIDEDEDDVLLGALMEATEQYITDSVGFYDAENPKTRILYMLIMQDFYENRVLIVRESDRQRLSHVVSSIVMQLQAEVLMKEGEAVG